MHEWFPWCDGAPGGSVFDVGDDAWIVADDRRVRYLELKALNATLDLRQGRCSLCPLLIGLLPEFREKQCALHCQLFKPAGFFINEVSLGV
ncbi:MAG: hypothetical protein ACI8Z1_003391 [Candidatus Azotimanducaceae bacterium]|jgi:hypothetical protein